MRLLGCWVLLLTQFATAQERHTLVRRVTDHAGVLAVGEIALLERELAAFEDSTSTQIAVLVVRSTGGVPIEEFALRVAEENRIGRKGRDNGVLLVVAMEDREVRIEVGYGLEGAIPDALAGRIVRNEIIPQFRSGKYFAGIHAGTQALMLASRNEYQGTASERDASGSAVPLILVLILLFFLMRGLGGGKRRLGMLGPTVGMGMGRRSSFGGGWRGGGGSFGGGGATGRW